MFLQSWHWDRPTQPRGMQGIINYSTTKVVEQCRFQKVVQVLRISSQGPSGTQKRNIKNCLPVTFLGFPIITWNRWKWHVLYVRHQYLNTFILSFLIPFSPCTWPPLETAAMADISLAIFTRSLATPITVLRKYFTQVGACHVYMPGIPRISFSDIRELRWENSVSILSP